MEVLLNDFKNLLLKSTQFKCGSVFPIYVPPYSPSSLYIYANTLLSIVPMYSHWKSILLPDLGWGSIKKHK